MSRPPLYATITFFTFRKKAAAQALAPKALLERPYFWFGFRQALGTAVFGGMVTSTVLAVFFVPVFYVAIQGLIELFSGPPRLIVEDEPHGAGAAETNGHGTPQDAPSQLTTGVRG